MATRLDDLPPRMREQAARKLGEQRRPTGSKNRVSTPQARPVLVDLPTEHQEQSVFVRWLQLSLPEMYEMTTAVPHGGFRRPAEAALLIAEGVSAGYPDLLIDLPRGAFHGLRIEMKRKNATSSAVSPEQLAWHARLRRRGYEVAVTRGADEAMAVSAAYWELGDYCPVLVPR